MPREALGGVSQVLWKHVATRFVIHFRFEGVPLLERAGAHRGRAGTDLVKEPYGNAASSRNRATFAGLGDG